MSFKKWWGNRFALTKAFIISLGLFLITYATTFLLILKISPENNALGLGLLLWLAGFITLLIGMVALINWIISLNAKTRIKKNSKK